LPWLASARRSPVGQLGKSKTVTRLIGRGLSGFKIAGEIGEHSRAPGDYDLITLQGLITHLRGEWFSRLAVELRANADRPDLARAMFDSHLCVGEYLQRLAGVSLAQGDRAEAHQKERGIVGRAASPRKAVAKVQVARGW
jgi:hypothetical protein